uniref:GG11853 n=1 Tax=Drosophila erecta TaxID=7220 RepID=B3P505_DROER
MEDVDEGGDVDVDGGWCRRGAHYANIATCAAATLGQLQQLGGKAEGDDESMDINN